MNGYRLPAIRVGDIIEIAEGHYCYGLGRLLLEVVEVGHRERHSDGIWLHVRGVELRQSDRIRLRQRRVLVRLDAVRIRPGPLARRRWTQRVVNRNQRPANPPRAHLAARPGWTCLACGQDWPCPERRAAARQI